jgi:hypothetical protein
LAKAALLARAENTPLRDVATGPLAALWPSSPATRDSRPMTSTARLCLRLAGPPDTADRSVRAGLLSHDALFDDGGRVLIWTGVAANRPPTC